MKKAELDSPNLRKSPDALVYNWQQEGYANALNVTFQLDVDTCKKVFEQSNKQLKARTSGIKRIIRRFPNKQAAQELLNQMQLLCKNANSRQTLLQNSNQSVENALEFNETYKKFNNVLQQK